MIDFKVNDMTCGHCVGRVTKAVQEVDSTAKLDINLEQKRVHIESAHAAAEFEDAIREAGYTPQAA